MGSVPLEPPPPRLNVDRFGMPQDYATYMWLVYRQRVADNSPQRRARRGSVGLLPDFGQQVAMR